MLHFVKNEEKYFISYGESKWEFTLNTQKEGAKLFYEKLKEKKRIELNFSYVWYDSKALFIRYNDNFSLDIENNKNNYEYPEPYTIFADHEELGIAINVTNLQIKYSIL